MDPMPWREGDNIPWHDSGFSRRMLAEHLSQRHDAASRRAETIDRHVAWIHGTLLEGRRGSVLDLGCGPGLYTSRLARLGHACVGIDYSPASIAYARRQADLEGLACTYDQSDVRTADYGAGHALAMMIFGEINVFRRSDALLVLRKAWAALGPGGVLLLEPHTFEALHRQGTEPSSWSIHARSVFADDPHLVLTEHFWRAESSIATTRHFVIDAGSAEVTRLAQSFQAYDLSEYEALLREAGWSDAQTWPSLTGAADATTRDFFVLVARKP
jgi:SAM-dependent methyltransferase